MIKEILNIIQVFLDNIKIYLNAIALPAGVHQQEFDKYATSEQKRRFSTPPSCRIILLSLSISVIISLFSEIISTSILVDLIKIF
jgi:hypothetical protein